MKTLLTLFNWKDTFPNIETYTKYENKRERIVNSNREAIWVKDCVFSGLNYNEYGGAIRSDSSTYLLVDSTFFDSVTISNFYGGAVYYDCGLNGHCVFKRVCSYACGSTEGSKTTEGQFCYIKVKKEESVQNYFDYSSAIHSKPTGKDTHSTLCLYNGNITICRSNVSYNKCKTYTAFFVLPSLSSSSKTTCTVSYSSISNNNNQDLHCMIFRDNYEIAQKPNLKMHQCNVISNTAKNFIIDVTGNLNVIGCCIINNHYTDGSCQAFDQHGISITIIDSTIDKTKLNPSIDHRTNPNPPFVVGLSLLKKAKCEANFDSIDSYETLKPSYTRIPFTGKTKARNVQYMRKLYKNFSFILFGIILQD